MRRLTRSEIFCIRRMVQQEKSNAEIADVVGLEVGSFSSRAIAYRKEFGLGWGSDYSRRSSEPARAARAVLNGNEVGEANDIYVLMAAPKSPRQLAYWHGRDDQ